MFKLRFSRLCANLLTAQSLCYSNTQSVDGEEGSDQTLEASPLREHDQLKDAFADMYQILNSWSNLHLSIYKLQ